MVSENAILRYHFFCNLFNYKNFHQLVWMKSLNFEIQEGLIETFASIHAECEYINVKTFRYFGIDPAFERICCDPPPTKNHLTQKSLSICIERLFFGGRYWVRTSDPLLVSRALCSCSNNLQVYLSLLLLICTNYVLTFDLVS